MEKLLIMSNFSFSHSVFKSLELQTRKNQGLFGKGLRNMAQVFFLSSGSVITTFFQHSHVFLIQGKNSLKNMVRKMYKIVIVRCKIIRCFSHIYGLQMLLALSQTSPSCYMAVVQIFENTEGKGEIAHNEQFLLFPQCFFTLSENFLPCLSCLKLLSANSFSLEVYKLLFGKRLSWTDRSKFLFGKE